MRTILVELTVDNEGYEDVCDELLIEDVLENLVGWDVRAEIVKDAQ